MSTLSHCAKDKEQVNKRSAKRRRFAPPLHPSRAPTVPNRAVAERKERPSYLRLEKAAAVAAAIAVDSLDERIDRKPPAPVTVSPVRVGVLERQPDYLDGERTRFVYLPVGGPQTAITVGLPVRGIDGETERIICELVANVLSNLEPAPLDD